MTSVAIIALAMALTVRAAPATSQEVIQNTQTQNAAISATQVLNVIENDGLTQADAQGSGNAVQGGNEDVDATLTSVQTLHGTVRASAHINGVNTGAEDLSLGTPAFAASQAVGNSSGFVTDHGHMTASTTQTSTAADVSATTVVDAPNNAIYVSGEGEATTEVNHTAYQVTNGRLDAKSWQSSSSDSNAIVSATVHYSPSPNLYQATATNNYYGSLSDDRGSQEHEVHQTQSGDTLAHSETYGGNVWNVAGQSTAIANRTDLQNQGGSLVVSNDQTQTGHVTSQAFVSADQYSTANAHASGSGNYLAAGDNDVYVRVDNTQLSSGGVDVSATFEGNNGYDSYISAEAYGNQALAYACSECKADMAVNSSQVNNSDVNATGTVTMTGQSRSIVASARAVGNSATYYVSGGH